MAQLIRGFSHHTVLKTLVCLLFVALPAASQPVQINSSDTIRIDPDHVTWLVDSSLDIDTARHLSHDQWQPLDKSSVSVPVRGEGVWFRLTLENRSDQALERIFEVRWINLRNIDVWQVSPSGETLLHTRAGLDVPYSEIDEHNSSWIQPFTMAPGEERIMYVRIFSEFTTFMPAYIWQPDAFQAFQQTRLYWYCLAFGALLALALYNLSLSAFTRDRSYLYYSIYALAAVAYEGGTSGIGHYAVWADWGWLRANMFFLSIYMAFLMSGIFIRRFLRLYERKDWIRYLADSLILFWGAGLIFHIVSGGVVVGGMIEIAALISCAIALIASLYLSWEGDVSARYFTVAWTGLLILTFFTVLMLQGLAPFNFMSENGQMMGFVVEMLLLSFALAERINRERSAREYAQKVALRMEQKANEERQAKLNTQEELLTMQRQANHELEIRVAQRTEALEQARLSLEEANRELSALSLTDPLTQLYNRRHLDATLSRETEARDRSLTLILTDIDHFKQFNDEHGHLAGDECLRIVAATLRSTVHGEQAMVARYGGEEFAIILEDSDIENGVAIAERVRKDIEALSFVYRGQRLPVRISVGVAEKRPGERPGELIARADEALYTAKAAGRNCVKKAG